MRYERLFHGVFSVAVFVAVGCGFATSYAESPKAILHDTGVKLKDATHDVESMVHHGSKTTKHEVKHNTVGKELKKMEHQSKKNLDKAFGK